MIPIIYPGENIHLLRVDPSWLRVGDAVFCRIKGSLTVHEIGAIDGKRFMIQNHAGHQNGWIGAGSVYGLAVKIEDRVLVSSAELNRRAAEVGSTDQSVNSSAT